PTSPNSHSTLPGLIGPLAPEMKQLDIFFGSTTASNTSLTGFRMRSRTFTSKSIFGLRSCSWAQLCSLPCLQTVLLCHQSLLSFQGRSIADAGADRICGCFCPQVVEKCRQVRIDGLLTRFKPTSDLVMIFSFR